MALHEGWPLAFVSHIQGGRAALWALLQLFSRPGKYPSFTPSVLIVVQRLIKLQRPHTVYNVSHIAFRKPKLAFTWRKEGLMEDVQRDSQKYFQANNDHQSLWYFWSHFSGSWNVFICPKIICSIIIIKSSQDASTCYPFTVIPQLECIYQVLSWGCRHKGEKWRIGRGVSGGREPTMCGMQKPVLCMDWAPPRSAHSPPWLRDSSQQTSAPPGQWGASSLGLQCSKGPLFGPREPVKTFPPLIFWPERFSPATHLDYGTEATPWVYGLTQGTGRHRTLSEL